jgi:hypothetical protein
MKTKTYPYFCIDGRRARTLRKLLGMPDTLKELNEDTQTKLTGLPLAQVRDALGLPPLKYADLAKPDAFLCGGALTAWIGDYPTSDYDFFFPDRAAAQQFHEKLLARNAQLVGYQGSEAFKADYETVKKGEMSVEEISEDAVRAEDVRALNYSIPTGERPDLIQAVLIIQGADPLAVINTFDFTVSMLGTDGIHLYFGAYTWTDLFRQRLRTHNIHHGISTMRRMVKYSKRGFYACVGTMRDIAQGVIDSPSDQPISVD